jgi:Fe-S cluster assembly protein SufD
MNELFLDLGKELLVQQKLNASDSPIHLDFAPHRKQSVILTLEGEGTIDVKVNVQAGAEITLLWWNRGQELTLDETYDVNENAHLILAYADLNEGSLHRKSEVRLVGAFAQANLRSASVVSAKRTLVYQMTHIHGDAVSTMGNYAVMAEGGDLRMEVVGRIEKSAPRSDCHQSSRVLSLSTHQKAMVLPKLFIDNNDVQAGHAQSIGQVDAEQLYYLQTRGLNRDEATKLIVYGYLYPVAEVIADEKLRELFLDEIREKVNQTCLT